jgi:3-deoxy-D-manno-octulosonic-acid transferase
MGPYFANFRAITEDLLAHQAVRIAAREELAQALIALLQIPTGAAVNPNDAGWDPTGAAQDLAGIARNPAEAASMGARARQVFDQQAGATGRCVEALEALLREGGRTN